MSPITHTFENGTVVTGSRRPTKRRRANIQEHERHFNLLALTQRLLMKSCALLTLPFFLSVFLLARSGGDPEHQLRGDGAQFPVPASPAPRLQAVLRVPGQILGVPLRCQLLRGLQGEKNLLDASG